MMMCLNGDVNCDEIELQTRFKVEA
jgi:hypothetical protein